MNIFVGCSSRDIGNEIYNNVADKIGEFIGENNHCLVFGGCTKGLMGRVYSKVKENKGRVIATQAKVYEDQVVGLDANQIDIVDTINGRKDRYTKYSNVLVFIPGGIGTIDELINAIETRRSGEHDSKIVIVNEDNFFGFFLNMLDKIYDEGLASSSTKELYYVVNNVEDAIKKLDEICK